MSTARKTILLVEDETLIALSDARRLENEGYAVVHAYSGEEAVAKVRAAQPAIDLVLMDIHLGPGIDGIDAARIILQDYDLPVVFLSSHTEPEVLEKIEKITSYGYVVKDSGIAVLAASIKMAFKLHAAHQALQRANASLSVAQVASRAGTWDWDIARDTFHWSPELLNLFGLPAGTAAGFEAWTQSLHPEDREAAVYRIQEAMFGKTALVNDYRIVLPNREVRWIRMTGRIYYAGDRPLRMACLCQDITERKQVEEALAESEAHFRGFFEQSAVGMAVTSPGKGWLAVNPAACNALGYSAEELSLMTWAELTHPADLEADLAQFNRVLAGEIDCYRLEKRFVRKDGQVVHINLGVQCKRKPGGQVDYILATLSDITERKQAETIMQARLRIADFAARHSLDELLQNALDELCALTGSPIGFFHFVRPDQRTISLQAWSTRTLKEMCTTEGKGHSYGIDQAGVWMDCLREGRPVIHNDYASLPHRKGMPEGHAPVVREMVFPIIRDGEFVAITGVGNKPEDYTQDDLAYASRLADLIWDIVEHTQAGEALKEKDELLSSAVEAAPIILFTLDTHGVFQLSVGAGLKSIGLAPGQVVGLSHFDVYKELESANENVRRALNGETVHFTIEALGVSWDVVYAPLYGPRREITGMVGTAVDITERKRAEETLRAGRKLLQDIAANYPNSYVSIIEQDLTIGFTSGQEFQKQGLDPQHFVGLALEQVFGEQAPVVREHYLKAFQGSETEFELFINQQHQLYRAIPLADHDGEVRRILVVVENITVRRRAETALRESETRHRTILQTAMDGFWLADTQGRLVEVNETYCQMSGYSPQELLAMRIPDVEAVETESDTAAHIQAVIAQGADRFESRHRRKDGSVFDVEVSVQYQDIDGGRFVTFLHDITERKRAEAALQQALAEKETLMHELQHRVKNSLAIAASLIGLEANNLADGGARAIFANTQARLQTITSLYDHLNQAGRLDRVNMRHYLRTLVETLARAYLTEDSPVKIETRLADLALKPDRAMLLGLIVNELVTNALKYAFPDGRGGFIRVELEEGAEATMLCVSDDGLGMTHSPPQARGSGLGMTLVEILAGQLGGRLIIENQAGVTARVEFRNVASRP